VPNIIKTTHCLAAMSIKDHLIKLTMCWQGAQKLRNDRPGGRPPPCPPSVSPLVTAENVKFAVSHWPNSHPFNFLYETRLYRGNAILEILCSRL